MPYSSSCVQQAKHTNAYQPANKLICRNRWLESIAPAWHRYLLSLSVSLRLDTKFCWPRVLDLPKHKTKRATMCMVLNVPTQEPQARCSVLCVRRTMCCTRCHMKQRCTPPYGCCTTKYFTKLLSDAAPSYT